MTTQTYRAVLAEPRFRAVFGSRTLSIASETLRILALSVLVYAVTGSPMLGAVAFGAGFLPQAVGGVLLGALPDRLPPRRLVVGGYALESAAAVTLALGRLPVGWCLALVATVACLTPVFTGASSRVVAEALTGDAYVLGRSLLSMASSAAQLLGLAAGGIAVAALGSRHALLVAAGGNALAAVWARLGLPNHTAPSLPGGTAPEPHGARQGTAATPHDSPRRTTATPHDSPRRTAVTARGSSAVRASLRGSVALVTDRTVRRLMLLQWLPPTLMTAAEALLVPYGAARGFAPGVAGLLLAAAPVGMLTGDLVVGRFLKPATRERFVPALVVLVGAPLPILVLNPPLAVVVLALAACGAGSAYTLGIQRPFLEALPGPMRGQGFALLSTGLMTCQGLGPVLSGALATWTGPAVAIAVAGAAAVATVTLAKGATATPSRGPTATPAEEATATPAGATTAVVTETPVSAQYSTDASSSHAAT